MANCVNSAKKLFHAHGYRAQAVSSGLACLEELRALRPAALVLDQELRWGGSDGVLAWLREERVASPAIVIVTGSADSRLDEA